MDKIRKMSIVLKSVFWGMLLILPVCEILGWIYFDGYDSWLVPGILPALEGENFVENMGWASRIMGIGIGFPSLFLDMYCIWQMIKLFSLYSRGRIFTSDNSSCYRRAAWALLANEFISPIIQTGTSLAVSMNNPEGERFVSIGFSDANVANIIIACVILAVSWVTDEGLRLREEAELTI